MGIGFCIFLYPRNADFGLILLKSKKYQAAEKIYLKDYQNGDHSPAVVLALVKIYEGLNLPDKAISYIQEYLEKNPEDPDALQILANLYLRKQDYEHYFLTLEKIRSIDPSKADVRELSKNYLAKGEHQKYCSSLEDLIAQNKGEESDYKDLAYCYAYGKNFLDASEALEIRRKKFPQKVQLQDILFEARMLHEGGQKNHDSKLDKQGVELIADYLLEKNDPKLAIQALSEVDNLTPNQVPYFTERLSPLVQRSQALENSVLELRWYNKKEERAEVIQDIIDRYGVYPKDAKIQRILVESYIMNRKRQLILNQLDNAAPDLLNDQLISDLSSYALMEKNPELALKVQQMLGPDYLDKNPVQAALLAFAAETGSHQDLDRLVSNKTLTTSELYQVLKFALATQNNQLAEKVAEALFTNTTLTEEELFWVVDAYVRAGREQEIYGQLTQNMSIYSKAKQELALVLLYTATGRSKSAAEWLKEHRIPPEDILNELYRVATEKEESPLALYIAKLIKERYPSFLADGYYAEALVRVGKVDAGMKVMEEVYESHQNDPDVISLYFSALTAAAKLNPSYSKKMAEMLKKIESHENVPPWLTEALAYVYIENLGDYEKGESLLVDKVESGTATKDDIDTLIYLWGPKVTIKQRDWIFQKASESCDEDLPVWLEHLAYIGDFCAVIELFEKRIGFCSCCNQVKCEAYFTYLGALAYCELRCKMRYAIPVFYPRLTDLSDLIRLADFANQVQLYQISTAIWQCVVGREPFNLDAWFELSDAVYNEGNYRLALKTLSHYFNLGSSLGIKHPMLYRGLYEYGVSLETLGCCKQAKSYYIQSIGEICCRGTETFLMIETLSLSLERLYIYGGSLAVMRQLYQYASHHPDVAASFAGLMMDMGKIRKTKRFIYNGISP